MIEFCTGETYRGLWIIHMEMVTKCEVRVMQLNGVCYRGTVKDLGRDLLGKVKREETFPHSANFSACPPPSAFSPQQKEKVIWLARFYDACICMLSHFRHVWFFVTRWTVVHQAPLSMELFPSPGDLPNSGIKPVSLLFPALAGGFFTTSATWEALYIVYVSQSQFPSSLHSPSHLDISKFVVYIFVCISVLQVSSSVPLF